MTKWGQTRKENWSQLLISADGILKRLLSCWRLTWQDYRDHEEEEDNKCYDVLAALTHDWEKLRQIKVESLIGAYSGNCQIKNEPALLIMVMFYEQFFNNHDNVHKSTFLTTKWQRSRWPLRYAPNFFFNIHKKTTNS